MSDTTPQHDPTGHEARVGLITPSANPSIEPEIAAMLPRGCILHTTRLPAHTGSDMSGRLAAYRDDIDAAVASFGALPLKAVLFGCTGSSYSLGPDGDHALTSDLLSRLGVPVISAAGATERALRALRAQELWLISPYPDWLTDACVAYWTQAGFRVRGVTSMAQGTPIYRIAEIDASRAVQTCVEQIAVGRSDTVVLVAGTGAPSLKALDAASTWCGVPLLSSNVAGAWQLARAAGCGDGLGGSRSATLRRLHELTGGVREAVGQ